ncbi:DUF368 domain-containing protein [Natronosalvus halobius]|uniref:DUF368 domain-containing protein n=1 Tax=Natronosalvus halobius TaxID=2953746 RepID=UPI0020A02D10|nr:DUF368 domain-containing protein [Natronosalvus halobius]USZ71535.1 DUF368 domain-containing protein [Natronosalvus halobius]
MGYSVDERLVERLSMFRIYAYGLCMGTADALPGVSGGTIALLLGFYGRLIAAITSITPSRIWTVLNGVRPGNRNSAREALLEMDVGFLLPLGIGAVTAVALIASAVASLAESHPVALFGFFTGLIGASAIVLYRELRVRTRTDVLAAIAGASLALLIAANVLELPGSGAITIVFAGALAISAMILPGVSGSLILILLGQYVFLSGELSAFLSGIAGLVGGGSLEAVIAPGTTVVLFVAGGLVGLLSVARIVRAALDRHRNTTLLFLVSLIAGSTPAPLHNIGETHTWTADTIVLAAVWTLVGALALFALDRLVGGFDPE